MDKPLEEMNVIVLKSLRQSKVEVREGKKWVDAPADLQVSEYDVKNAMEER